jgi:hypothetical protein
MTCHSPIHGTRRHFACTHAADMPRNTHCQVPNAAGRSYMCIAYRFYWKFIGRRSIESTDAGMRKKIIRVKTIFITVIPLICQDVSSKWNRSPSVTGWRVWLYVRVQPTTHRHAGGASPPKGINYTETDRNVVGALQQTDNASGAIRCELATGVYFSLCSCTVGSTIGYRIAGTRFMNIRTAAAAVGRHRYRPVSACAIVLDIRNTRGL